MRFVDKTYLIINGLILCFLGWYFQNETLAIPGVTIFNIGLAISKFECYEVKK